MASVTMDPNGASADAISLNTASQRTCMAAVAIAAGQFCYINGSLGTGIPSAHLTDATSAGAPVCGIAATRAGVNNPITLFGKGAKIHYAAPGTFTPGAMLFLDVTANAGGLSTTATTGDAVGVAVAISDTDIQVVRDFTNAVGG